MVGHEMFIRHLIAKKLDDHIYRSGVYVFAHLPRPLGSISFGEQDVREAYLYEWAFCSGGFSWMQPGMNDPINPPLPTDPNRVLKTLSSTTTLWRFRRFHDKGLL